MVSSLEVKLGRLGAGLPSLTQHRRRVGKVRKAPAPRRLDQRFPVIKTSSSPRVQMIALTRTILGLCKTELIRPDFWR